MYLEQEVPLGCMACLVPGDMALPRLQISPCGVIPECKLHLNLMAPWGQAPMMP